MRITIEKTLGADVVETFHTLYVAAFDPVRVRAAARHMLTAGEFAAEMADGRIDKYVAWDDDDRPAALSTLATDLTAVPWISPDYFAAQFPDAFARGAVYYVGYTLVHPKRAGRGVFEQLLTMIAERCAEQRVVCGWDICAYNDARRVGSRAAGLGESHGAVVTTLDVQTYYAANFDRSSETATPAG